MASLRIVLLPLLCISLLGCGDDDRRRRVDSGEGFDADVPDTGVEDAPLVDARQRDANVVTVPPVIWLHSGRELFRFNPETREVVSVGILDATNETIEPQGGMLFFSMTDIAVRSDGAVYGLGRGKIWTVNTETAMATWVVDEVPRSVAMSFVPAGVLSSQEELVIGYGDRGEAKLGRVDLETGRIVELAAFNGDCETAGDIAAIEGLGTYITLRCSNDESQDFLAEVDVSNGSIDMIGGTGVKDIWGLAFWAGTFYGVTKGSELVSIDANTGRATIIDSSITADELWGAGVTTIAPLM